MKRLLFTIQLHAEGVDLEQADDAAGFLAVYIERNPKTRFLNMGVIKQELETLCLNVGTANGKFTPGEGKHFAKHVHKELAFGNLNYICVVEMLLYLTPDIIYNVNCAARYLFCPKLVDEYIFK
ncbi:LOW QUALITY PROTEIN: hypothetical protein ACHAXS_000176 [Conticribra weissflogii]